MKSVVSTILAVAVLSGQVSAGVSVTVVATPKPQKPKEAAAQKSQQEVNSGRQRFSGISVRVVGGIPAPPEVPPAVPPVAPAPQSGGTTTPSPAAEPVFTPEVLLYTSRGCGACVSQRNILDAAGIRYTTKDGSHLASVPQVWISQPNGRWKFWSGVVSADAVLGEIDRVQGLSLSADHQPTSHFEVHRVLKMLAPRPYEVFVDYGCGDGRFVIAAAKNYGCRAIGIEIDPQRASVARQNVQDAGVGHLVQIIEGDVRDVDVEADVGVAYLWPEMLSQLKPQILDLDRFASCMHPVPGLAMTENSGAWVWRKAQPFTSSISRAAPQRTATWGGRQYASPVCNNPNCRMCASIRAQLYGNP